METDDKLKLPGFDSPIGFRTSFAQVDLPALAKASLRRRLSSKVRHKAVERRRYLQECLREGNTEVKLKQYRKHLMNMDVGQLKDEVGKILDHLEAGAPIEWPVDNSSQPEWTTWSSHQRGLKRLWRNIGL